MNKQHDIFISYATEDKEYATKLVTSLNHLGLTTWFAPLNLEVGDNLAKSIDAVLTFCKFAVVIISPEYTTKNWTQYELNTLNSKMVENKTTLFPIWHGIDKKQIEVWNASIANIVALNSSMELSLISEKISGKISGNAPIRGVSPSYENPQWRFLWGYGELMVNSDNGPAFNIFGAAEFPDKDFPLYIYNHLYSKKEIVSKIVHIIFYHSYDEHKNRVSKEDWDKLFLLCKIYGFDVEDEKFDPAIECPLFLK